MIKKIINLGIICPRNYLLGGLDNNTEIRVLIRNYIKDVVDFYSKNGYKIIGYSGVSLGIEQDFLQILTDNDFRYYCYLPFENQENIWQHGNDKKKYKEFLQNAENAELLNNGNYAPKKVIQKKKFITSNCDAIIYIYTKSLHKSLLSLLNIKRQHLHILSI